MKETEGVLIMQLSLQLSRLDKVICYSTIYDDQLICLMCISIFVISEVFEDSSLRGVGFFTYVLLTRPKGALINYDREGRRSISEKSEKNFKPPPIQEIKIQTPSRFQRIISDPNTPLQRENIHILVSNACHSICPSVSVAYTSSKDSQMNSVSSKDN